MAVKQKSSLFSEESADQRVIDVLLKEIIILRSHQMPIVKTTDGKFYRVESMQEVTTDELQNELTELQAREAVLQGILNTSDTPSVAAPTEQAAPEQPANGDVNAAASEENAAQGQPEQPATPEQPTDGGVAQDSAGQVAESAATDQASEPALTLQ